MGSREDKVYANETRSTVTSTVEGVITEELGTVTGDLELECYELPVVNVQGYSRASGLPFVSLALMVIVAQ